jgi:hypothetical protein
MLPTLRDGGVAATPNYTMLTVGGFMRNVVCYAKTVSNPIALGIGFAYGAGRVFKEKTYALDTF